MKPSKYLTITGGIYRGRHLYAPDHVRPTSQRAREALMSKLASLWGGPVRGCVADVCAGSGALGVELLSRGAKHVTFVDVDLQAVKENVSYLNIAESFYSLIKADARKKLPDLLHAGPLDVLVTDPPYGVASTQTWVNSWLHWVVPDHTVVCLEQESEQVQHEIVGLKFLQEASYGRATWTIWVKETTDI